MSAKPNPGRRRALALVTGPAYLPWWPSTALGLPFDDRRMLEGLTRELGLLQTHAFRQLAQRIRVNADAALVTSIAGDVTQRLQAVIGATLHTARSTVPSVVEDDFAMGRTMEVRGIVFSHTELVLLLAVSDQVAAGVLST